MLLNCTSIELSYVVVCSKLPLVSMPTQDNLKFSFEGRYKALVGLNKGGAHNTSIVNNAINKENIY